jgi:hypothetical protein
MKLFAFFNASTLLGLALASPTAVREIFEAAELDKRACTSLSYASMLYTSTLYFIIIFLLFLSLRN